MRIFLHARLLALVVIAVAALPAAEPLLRDGDRLAICGDTVLDGALQARGAAIMMEGYLIATRPEKIATRTAIFGAGSIEQLLGSLDANLGDFAPTAVVLAYGNGDGRAPLDPPRAEKFRKDLTALIATLRERKVRAIVVASPKCVDSTFFHKDANQAKACNDALKAYSALLGEVAAHEHVAFADVFAATSAAMAKVKAAHPDYRMDGDDDGWNPSEGCALLMAATMLDSLGVAHHESRITVDFAKHAATATPGQAIVGMDGQTLTVETTQYPFRYPLGEPLLACFPPGILGTYVLEVEHAPTAAFRVTWKEPATAADFTAADLAKGVDLGQALFTPCAPQLDGILGSSTDQESIERDMAFAQRNNQPIGDLPARRDSAAAKARSMHVPVRYSIMLQPLATVPPQPKGPIPVIYDTDMDGDVDDAGGLALLNRFATLGEAKLVACVTNTINTELSSGGTCRAINAYYGHGDVPIGCYHGEDDPGRKSKLDPAPAGAYHGKPGGFGSHYTAQVRARFAPDCPTDDQLPAGVDVYRKALAGAADGSVVICSVGLMQNVQDLIQSQPDDVSPLSGIDLVKKKVRQLDVMANTVPEDAYLLSRWPTPIVWTTFVGTFISAGRSLQATPEDNPVRLAYSLFGDNAEHNAMKDGRQCWDLTAAWLAIRGPGEVFNLIPGHWRVNGPNEYGTWIDDYQGRDFLAIEKMRYDRVSELIEHELSTR